MEQQNTQNYCPLIRTPHFISLSLVLNTEEGTDEKCDRDDNFDSYLTLKNIRKFVDNKWIIVQVSF